MKTHRLSRKDCKQLDNIIAYANKFKVARDIELPKWIKNYIILRMSSVSERAIRNEAQQGR